jgi:hypothetical protein
LLLLLLLLLVTRLLLLLSSRCSGSSSSSADDGDSDGYSTARDNRDWNMNMMEMDRSGVVERRGRRVPVDVGVVANVDEVRHTWGWRGS